MQLVEGMPDVHKALGSMPSTDLTRHSGPVLRG